jgi:Flp pilus assembly protein TadG
MRVPPGGSAAFWRGPASERGQAIILVALFMTTMLMAVGLAVDAGQLYVARRTMQEAADAAAYAGAVVLYQGGTTAQASAAAVNDASRNQYVDGGDGGLTTVTVNLPPTSGPHSSPPDSRYVEVIIASQVRTALLPAQAQLNFVSVRAVAGAEPLNNGYAIMALDRGNTPSAIDIGPTSSVSVTGAGILSNSTSSSAASNAGGSISVSPYPPYGTEVAGGVSGTWPHPTTGVNQKPDPFAGYPKPSTGGLPVYDSLPAPVGSSPPTITLSPGVYNVAIDAAGGTLIVMNSGIYILKGQGINGTGNADIQSGAGGVFIFNTLTGYPGSTGTCTGIKLAGNAASVLAPMATGTYAGLLFYQDPACTAEFKIAGNGTLSASGTIYLPNAPFVMDGSNATLTGSQLVAKTVDINNGTINITFNSGTTAQPVLPRLAE